MKSNLFSKTVKRFNLWAVITAVLLVAAVVVMSVFGFNKDATLRSANSLTVSVNSFAYDTRKAEIVDACEGLFGDLEANYMIEGEMTGDDCELVFVFDEGVNLLPVEKAIEEHFQGEGWEGVSVNATASIEYTGALNAKGFRLRALIAGVVFAVLAFAYVAIRFRKVWLGVIVGGSAVLAMGLTVALVILTRVPVTVTVVSVVAIAGLLTTAMVMLTVSRAEAAKSEEEASAEEKVVSSIAAKEILLASVAIVIAVIAIGILGKTAAAWFALSAIYAIVACLFVSLLLAPAALLTAQLREDAKPKVGYQGAKKTSTRTKKIFSKKAPEVEETAEEPAEEPAPEVEEPITETEESVEEPAPEAEEAEAPAEEAEEAEEEKTEE